MEDGDVTGVIPGGSAVTFPIVPGTVGRQCPSDLLHQQRTGGRLPLRTASTAWRTQRIGPGTPLHVVDAILSGTHEKGTSHYELLRAFASTETLARMEQQLDAHGYRTHEFGDSIRVEKGAVAKSV
jgi:hypothetical protein